ncbi:MAG: amidohydrolase family protein, partial [bacterium]
MAHCPIANAKLGHGIAPLAAFLAHGIHTGLGTDSVASNNRMHLLDEARQAVLLASLRAGTPDALSAHDALRLAPMGGAQALGMDDRIGTLEA